MPQWRGNEGELRGERKLRGGIGRWVRPFDVYQPLGTSETNTKTVSKEARTDAPTLATFFAKVDSRVL